LGAETLVNSLIFLELRTVQLRKTYHSEKKNQPIRGFYISENALIMKIGDIKKDKIMETTELTLVMMLVFNAVICLCLPRMISLWGSK